jgi:NitT/TauT family transport system substrate-binding protein
MRYARALAALLFLCAASHALALDRVTFATNWLAEAEHGGFYQPLTDGTYERYGLDVKIIQGGPQANNQLLLAAGRVDFYLGANMIQALHAVEQGIPTLVVASLFQKDRLF